MITLASIDGRKRRKVARLDRLLALLRPGQFNRAEDLAEVMDVSARTIQRDMDHLRAQGVPVRGEAGLGCMLMRARR